MSDEPRWVHVHTIDEMQAFYLAALPRIREAARVQGYAIGLHGSTRRDLDLIAVPWVEQHGSRDELAEAIHVAACGFRSSSYQWEEKPNGRFAASFPVCWTEWRDMVNAGHIDLSVVSAAGRASMQRELEGARLQAKQAIAAMQKTVEALRLRILDLPAEELEKARARIAELEAGQVNAAVEMLRAECAALQLKLQGSCGVLERELLDESWERLDGVADWLESQAKAPREANNITPATPEK